jgi:hypothetical protein
MNTASRTSSPFSKERTGWCLGKEVYMRNGGVIWSWHGTDAPENEAKKSTVQIDLPCLGVQLFPQVLKTFKRLIMSIVFKERLAVCRMCKGKSI